MIGCHHRSFKKSEKIENIIYKYSEVDYLI